MNAHAAHVGSRLVARLLSLLAPPRCPACGGHSDVDRLLCASCDRELAASRPVFGPTPPGVDAAVAASTLDGVARMIVVGLKYGRRLSLARAAAAAILKAIPDGQPAAVVVPVPAGPGRWRWRGFDPAEEIAIALAALSGLPFDPCLRRSRGRRQVGRARRDRLSDPPRVWAARSAPARALLVDDVWTTGATLAACARALRAAGCESVVSVTLARTEARLFACPERTASVAFLTPANPTEGGRGEDRGPREERRADG